MNIRFKNLRLTDGLYVPAGNIAAHTAAAGHKPLGRIAGRLITSSAAEIYVEGSEAAAAIDSEVLCAANISDKEIIAMTAAGAVAITAGENSPAVQSLNKFYPEAVLKAVDYGPVSTTVKGRRLSSATTNGSLATADSRALTEDLASAYRRLCELGAGSGTALQPALGRYKLIGADGTELFTSPPVLLCHSCGSSCCESVPVYSTDGNYTDSYQLTAQTWKISLTLPGAAGTSGAEVARMDIMLTPLFHPYDSSMPGGIEYGNRATSADPIARVSLPGRCRGLGTPFAGNGARMIKEAIARMEALERCIHSIHNPFGGAERTVIISVNASPEPQADTQATVRALATPVRKHSLRDVLLAGPHSFSAGRVAAGASAWMWSDITALPFRGYGAQTFAACDTTQAQWRAIVAVRFADGKGVVHTTSGDSGAFTSLSPVLSYPSPEAEEMIIAIFTGNRTIGGTFALSPDPSGRFSVYISPDLKPISLSTVPSTQIFDYEAADTPLNGVVAFSHAATPLRIELSAEIRDNVIALLPRINQGQSWEFGRARFIAASRRAIYSLNLNRGMTAVAMHTVCERGLGRADALCHDGDGGFYAVGTACAADGDGLLLHIGRTGAVTDIMPGERLTACGYNTAMGELWLLRTDGTYMTLRGDDTASAVARTGVAAGSFAHCGRELFIVTDTALYEPAIESTGTVDIEARFATVPASYRPAKTGTLHIDMQAGQFDGEVSVTGQSVGNLRPWLMRKLTIDGTVAGPLRIPVVWRRCRAAEVVIHGRTDHTFKLHGL